jgi:hypothetical protein
LIWHAQSGKFEVSGEFGKIKLIIANISGS